jgi:predicted MFS family arabinose efflux permease
MVCEVILCWQSRLLTHVGLLYLPGLALVGRSFKKHRSMAMAITTCGAPVGGIIYTLMFQQLINRLGFPWTIRAMAFFMLGTYLISFPLQLWGASNLGDLSSGQRRKMFDPTALRDLPFWSYSFCNFFIFTGYMIPFIYIAAYGQEKLGLTQSTSLNMIIAAQAASVGGRLIAGYIASKIGVMIPWITAAASSGVFCIAWIGVDTKSSFVAFACLYGGFSGSLIPLPPSVFPVVCPDREVLGARLGMAQAIGSVASLIGAPIAGALLTTGKGGANYLAMQLFSGLMMILGACQLVGLYILLVRKRDVGKWI